MSGCSFSSLQLVHRLEDTIPRLFMSFQELHVLWVDLLRPWLHQRKDVMITNSHPYLGGEFAMPYCMHSHGHDDKMPVKAPMYPFARGLVLEITLHCEGVGHEPKATANPK